MGFRISALPEQEFEPLFALDDAQLSAVGAKRYIADRRPGYPCRVSLEDAAPGESVLLVPFRHQPADSPYRASGPVFVREHARRRPFEPNDVPEVLRSRLLSVRAYDIASLMVDADVVEGRDLEALIERVFGNPDVRYLHVHFARPGCYACRVDRA
jgi:hypothetical protein